MAEDKETVNDTNCLFSDEEKKEAIQRLENVMNDNIKFHPSKLKNMYRAWMENINDWCISRQLWWGHQIPAYYLPSGEFVVAESREEALKLAQEIDKNKLLSAIQRQRDL